MATKIDKQALRQKIQDLQVDNNLKSELLAAICEQKTFGLVWEEKDEEAQDILRDNIPVLKEVTEKRNALYQYMQEYAAKGKKIVGGVLIKDEGSNNWYYPGGTIENTDSIAGWSVLNLSIL